METIDRSSSTRTVPLVSGVRAVFENAGFSVTNADDEHGLFALVANPPTGPSHGVVCREDAENMSRSELEAVRTRAQVMEFQKIDIISKGQFSGEVFELAEEMGFQITDGTLFSDAVNRLPEEILQSLEEKPPLSPFANAGPMPSSFPNVSPSPALVSDPSAKPEPTKIDDAEPYAEMSTESSVAEPSGDTAPVQMELESVGQDSAVVDTPTQSHQGPPQQQVPAPPISLYDDPKPKSKGKGCLIAGIIGAVLFVGLIFVAIVAAIAIPSIGRINEAAIEAKGRRLAQNYASIAASAQAVGLDFIQSPDASVPEVLDRLSSGMVVSNPESPFNGTFFGVPGVGPEDRAMAAKYLVIESGHLLYLEQEEPLSGPRAGPGTTRPSQSPQAQGFSRPDLPKLSQEEDALLVMSIPDDAPTWATAGQKEEEAYLRQYWRLDQIEDPEIKAFGEALLKRQIHRVAGEMDFPDGQHVAGRLMSESKAHPRLAFAALIKADEFYPRKTNAVRMLLNLARTMNDPFMAYQLSCMELQMVPDPERLEAALRSLEVLLDETKGLQEDSNPVATIFDGPSGDSFHRFHENFAGLVIDHPEVPDWFKKLIEGKHYIRAAWEARGSGFADSVTEEAGKEFASNLHLAEQALTESWNQHPNHPYAAALMLLVCKGKSASLEETRMWFDRSISIRADYTLAYDYFTDYLQPKWHGSEAHLAAFGKACHDTGRFDTMIPEINFKCHILRANQQSDPLGYWRSLPADEMSELKVYFGARENQPVTEAYQRINRSIEAVFWYSCGREDELMRCLELLDFSVDPHALRSMPVEMKDIQRVIEASGAMQASVEDRLPVESVL